MLVLFGFFCEPINTQKLSIGLYGGPSLGLGLLGCLELDGEEIDMDWSDDGFNRTEFSWTFGADVQFQVGVGKFVIDLRYLKGQSDVGGTTAKAPNSILTNNGFGLSLGYAYPLGIQED